jgi:hypothetical protein
MRVWRLRVLLPAPRPKRKKKEEGFRVVYCATTMYSESKQQAVANSMRIMHGRYLAMLDLSRYKCQSINQEVRSDIRATSEATPSTKSTKQSVHRRYERIFAVRYRLVSEQCRRMLASVPHQQQTRNRCVCLVQQDTSRLSMVSTEDGLAGALVAVWTLTESKPTVPPGLTCHLYSFLLADMVCGAKVHERGRHLFAC